MGQHGDCHSHCGIFGIFLGCLTGLIWLLLAVLGIIAKFFAVLGLNLGILGTIIIFIIALIGFLACIFFGICIFKKVWHCCRSHKSGC